MKVYKKSIFSMLYFLVVYAIGAGFIYFVSTLFTRDFRIIYGLTALAVAAGIYSLSSGFRLKVVVDRDTVTFFEGKKATCFNIDETSFSSMIVNRDDMNITAKTEGETASFDCSFLGMKQFSSLLDDLKITGENQPVYQLATSKEDN